MKVCTIPLLNTYERWLPCFSEEERAVLDKRIHEMRRRRWVTSRIAMKYLVLSATDHSAPCDTLTVHESDLERFPTEKYVDTLLANRYGELVTTGLPNNATLSLGYISTTYNNETATLVQSWDPNVSADRENVMKNISEAFVKYNFTGQERKWCQQPLRGLSEKQAFTLIWTLKEALLKRLGTGKITLWAFGMINTNIESIRWTSNGRLAFEGEVNIDDNNYAYEGQSEVNTREILSIITTKFKE